MCGIAGIVALSDKGRQQVSKIQQSVRTLRARGPDDEGIWMHEHVALAQRRLSIIDTSKAANQPMWDHSRRYALVFNGEIFNFRELRSKFFTAEEQGLFHTHSDTEVLVELYSKMGAGCLQHLEGFFAFAIYDTLEDELFIARDRFGKKPLNFFMDEDRFIFASELKALYEFGIPKELNYESLHFFLQLSYIPQPLSILKHIRKIDPGHYLILKNGEPVQKKWYEWPPATDYHQALNYEDAQDRLIDLAEAAVVKRLISDVPLGAFLSGGIDSSVIVALASRHVNGLNTFSIGFRGEGFFDETHFAEMIARKFKTHHAAFSLGIDDYLAHIFDVLDYLDEPFADTSSLLQYILCRETRKHATVAISGDGGDEVFAGYNKHYAEWQARQHTLAGFLVKAGGPLWKKLPKSRNSRISNFIRQLDRFADTAHLSAKERYWQWASAFSPAEVRRLLHETAIQQSDTSTITDFKNRLLKHINDTDFNSVLRTDMNLVLTGDMLVKVDLMSMANSVEVRSPFLDHHLVEFAFSLPAGYKIDRKKRKKILRDAFRNILPPEIYNRGKKGFEIPMLSWFRNELHTFIFDELLGEKFVREQQIFNFDEIARLRKQLNSSAQGNIVEQLWILIVFQYWYKKYFV